MDKEDRRRIKQLLTDAVLVLCKASLRYQRKFTVEGLLGITLDSDEVHLININELVEKEDEDTPTRTNGRDNHEQKRSSTIHQGASVTRTLGSETPSGREGQSRIAEKRSSSTSENEISEKRKRQEDLPVDLARVKNEGSGNPRNAEGAVDLSGAGDKATATMNDIAASAVRAVQQGLAQNLNTGLIQPRFPHQLSTPRRPPAPVPPFNNYAQFSLTPGLSPFRGRPRLSAAVNCPMDTVCSVCNFRCNTKTELYNHANTMKCKICPCPHCPKAFCDPGKLNQHITVRHEEPKFSCPLCGHRYSTKQNMQIHMRRHHGDQLYMQMMVQQSVRFHNPNSPLPPGFGQGQNALSLDFPFPGPGEDSLEQTSQSEDEDASSHAPHSPVNITPTTSYASMPLFPDQQAPVPLVDARTTPQDPNNIGSEDLSHSGPFPNLSQAVSNELDDPDQNDNDADDESEKGLDLHVPQTNHREDDLMADNHDQDSNQPIDMHCSREVNRETEMDGEIGRETNGNNDSDENDASDHSENSTSVTHSRHNLQDDRFDNPPELTLSSELTL